MVATVRCEEIANEKFSLLASDEVYAYFHCLSKTRFVSFVCG